VAAPHTHPAFDFRDAHTARFLPLWSVVPDERVSATGTDVMRVWAAVSLPGYRCLWTPHRRHDEAAASWNWRRKLPDG
jgi:hypothetical protein